MRQRRADLDGAAVLSGRPAGKHQMPGIGVGFIPKVLNQVIIDEIAVVTDDEAFETARRLAREEGILAGVSSGAAAHAALGLAAHPGAAGTIIVVLLADTGDRYVSSALMTGSPGIGTQATAGFVGTALYSLLPAVLRETRERYPAMQVRVEERKSAEQARLLQLGKLDLGLIHLPTDPSAGLDRTPVLEEPVGIALPAGHPLAIRDTVDLAGEAFVLFPPRAGAADIRPLHRRLRDGRLHSPGHSRGHRAADHPRAGRCRIRGGVRGTLGRGQPDPVRCRVPVPGRARAPPGNRHGPAGGQ
jgi:hypothetical protein